MGKTIRFVEMRYEGDTTVLDEPVAIAMGVTNDEEGKAKLGDCDYRTVTLKPALGELSTAIRRRCLEVRQKYALPVTIVDNRPLQLYHTTSFDELPELEAIRAGVVIEGWSYPGPPSEQAFEALPTRVKEWIGVCIVMHLFPSASSNQSFTRALSAKQSSSETVPAS